MRSRAARASALVVGDLAVVVLARPRATRLCADLARPRAWVAREGADAACAQLAGAAVWLVAAWLALGLVATAAGRLPGIGGRLGSWASRLVLPRAVRAALAGSAGLGVLLAPLAAGAATSGQLHRTTVSAPARSGSAPAPTVPTVPTPTWPLDTTTPHAHAGTPRPSAARPTTHRAPGSNTAARESVTVRPGDSLWLIAARRLGPHAPAAHVAATWPRWYAANRGVIGDDPTVITPGQVLHAPAATGKEDS